MSYSVRKHTIPLTFHPDEEGIKKRVMRELMKFPAVGADYGDFPGSAALCIELSGKSKPKPKSSQLEYLIHCTMISSPGPRIGFFGFYLDIPSGRLLLTDADGIEAPSLFDLYAYLETEFQYRVHPLIFAAELESWKMGNQTLETTLRRTYRASQGVSGATKLEGSKIRNLLRGTDSGDPLELRDEDFPLMARTVKSICRAFQRACTPLSNILTKEGGVHHNLPLPVLLEGLFEEVDKDPNVTESQVARDLIFALRSRGDLNEAQLRDMWGVLDKKTLKKGTEEWLIASEQLESLMAYSSHFRGLKKSEITAMSMFDLLKSSKVADEFLDASSDIFELVGFPANAVGPLQNEGVSSAKRILNTILDVSGVRELITPGTMSAVGRAAFRVDPYAHLASAGVMERMRDEHAGMAEWLTAGMVQQAPKLWARVARPLGRIYKHMAGVYGH